MKKIAAPAAPPVPGRRRLLEGASLSVGMLAGLGSATSRDASAAAPATPGVGDSQRAPLAEVSGKVAYITGASSGIGLGCARVLHDAGMKVVIGYIDAAQLRDALGHFPPNDPNLHTIRHDVTDRDAWPRVADEIEKKFGGTHLLVNNAGVSVQSPAGAAALKDWEFGMGVNFWGVVYGVNTFVPRMRARGEGAHILTIGSISGAMVGSGAGVYTVSKFAVAALMEELRLELQDANIGTSIVYPGFTASNFGQVAGNSPAPPRPTGSQMDPLELGRIVLDGIRHNDLFIFSHPEWKPGVQMRCDALMSSFVDWPVPAARRPPDPLRSTVYVHEVAHRKKTPRRPI